MDITDNYQIFFFSFCFFLVFIYIYSSYRLFFLFKQRKINYSSKDSDDELENNPIIWLMLLGLIIIILSKFFGCL